MAKKKTVERNYVTNIDELATLAESIGKELDNPPVSLDRGSYVEGAISFGSLILDLLTGGGLPPGKLTNAYGPEGSGKSTAAGHLIANATRQSIPVFFFDHETASDAKYFRALGVRMRLSDGTKNPYFHYYQSDTAEMTYRTMARLLRSLPDYTPASDGGRPLPQALFVIDSVASMLPEAIEEDDENVRMAAAASVHSMYLPLVKAKLGRKNVSLFATNQTRLNPGQMFGSPEYEPGGQAWRFYPDLKFRLSAVKQPFVERNRSMRFVNIATKKNKQFPPFLECKEMLTVAFGRGYERGRDSLGYLELTGQIEKSGNKRMIRIQSDAEYEWNNQAYFNDDLMKVLCTNEFRQACRAQLESDLAYKLFFKANDWDALYDFDEEAAEDAENELEALTSSLTPAPEPEAKVKRTKKGKTASEGEMSEEPSTKRRRVAVSSESSDEDDMGEILRD
jgi:recombination protein RecA